MSVREQSLGEISERIIYLDRSMRQRLASWLEYVAEFDRRGAARARGFSSTARWLGFECDMDARTAREYVQAARCLERLPLIAEAFGLGQLSYSQLRALSRIEEVSDERELLRTARACTARQLEAHVRQLRNAPSADPEVAARARSRRFLRHTFEPDGTLRFFGRLGAEDGAAFVEAIETRAATIHGDHTDCCCSGRHLPLGLGARRADAFVDLVTGGTVQTQVVLHADIDALRCTASGSGPRAGEVLYFRDGPAIPSDLARRLTCDAMVTVDGLNLGRSTRTVSPAQRRALEARDGRICSMPGCTRTHGLDAHHLIHWVNGGKTDLENLALFCSYHHPYFHEHGWNARRRHDRLVITDHRGHEVTVLPARASPRLALVA